VKIRNQVNKKSIMKLPNPVVTIFLESLGGNSGANLIRAIRYSENKNPSKQEKRNETS